MARDFDGANDYLQSTPHASFPDGTADLTFFCVAWSDDNGIFENIFHRGGTGGADGWSVAKSDLNKFTYSHPGVEDIPTALTFTTGAWWYLCFKKASNVITFFGRLATDAAITEEALGTAFGANAATGTTMRVANFTSGGNDWDGRIARVMAWDKALNDNVCRSLVMGGYPTFDGLKYWVEISGTTSPEPDWSGLNQHGTVNGQSNRIDHPRGIVAHNIWKPTMVQVAQAAVGQPTMRRWDGVKSMVPGPSKYARGW